jgi:hypothetical protein
MVFMCDCHPKSTWRWEGDELWRQATYSVRHCYRFDLIWEGGKVVVMEVVGREKRREGKIYQYIYLISLYSSHASVATLAWPDVSMT